MDSESRAPLTELDSPELNEATSRHSTVVTPEYISAVSVATHSELFNP